MQQTSRINRIAAVFLFALLLVAGAGAAFAQQLDEAGRLDELRRLREQLQATAALRGSDVQVMIHERVVTEAARRFIGLEVALSNGSTVRVTSIESELKTGAALVKIGLQAKSSVTVNLQLLGRLNSGELGNGVLRLPFRITEVKLANGLLSSIFIKSMLGAWLRPETWNDELPALELPVDLGETVRVPAARFDVPGELPMEIATPGAQAEMKLSLTSLLVLDKRMVLGLQLPGAAPVAIPASYGVVNDRDPRALEAEIESLAASLAAPADLRVRMGRRLIDALLAQLAGAQTRDLDIRLKPGRVRSEEVTAFFRITNFTDVESGEGLADIRELAIERIADGRIHLRLNAQGELDVRLRGREYGIPYQLSPRVQFAMQNQTVPLQLVSEEGRLLMRAVPGATLPLQVRFATTVAGHEIGIDRNLALQAERMLNRIELPAVFGRELPMPTRIEVAPDGDFQVTKKRPLQYILSNLRINPGEDVLDVLADVKFSTP